VKLTSFHGAEGNLRQTLVQSGKKSESGVGWCKKSIRFREQGTVLFRQGQSSERLEKRRFGECQRVRIAFPEKVQHDVVPGYAPNHENSLRPVLVQNLDDFARHHPAQSGADASFGKALVQGMGAVRFAEYRTSSGKGIGLFINGLADRFLQVHVHSLYLLEKKFAGAGGAFVAGLHGTDSAVSVEEIGQEGLSTSGNDTVDIRTGMAKSLIGMFHCFRFREGRNCYQVSERSSGDADPGRECRAEKLAQDLVNFAVMPYL